MKKAEYKEKKELILENISQLRESFRNLEEKYIKENAEFVDGDKVEVNTTGRNDEIIKEYGVVQGHIIYYDNVIPILYKIKKDGTISKHRLHIYSTSAIYKLIIEE